MKKIYFFFSSLISFLTFSQTILNQAETGARTVQDPNIVVLAPGFRAASSSSGAFTAKIGSMDDQSPQLPSTAGAGNPRGTIETENNRFHDTQGNIDVNGGGQLQFTLPVALPPGIKSVAPQINLIYTSGSGNGIAGYGWNLSGITSISRVGRTIEKDGEVRGIQLDYSDYYSFNGQRLILKSGEYGKDGAEYVTEKFSNIKIKSVGAVSGVTWKGPEYWEVTFEDGSQAWYGATTSGANDARTPVEYNIVKWKDAQGNYITYSYTQANNVSLISSIQWGGNDVLNTQCFNEISFQFKQRKLKENSYLKGHLFVQQSILTGLTVSSGGKQFKKYELNHDFNADAKYEFVHSATEYNSVNKAANPIIFKYEKPEISEWKESRVRDNNGSGSDSGINGDFDGDGNVDLIKAEGEQLFLYKNIFTNSSPAKIPLGNVPADFGTAVTFTIKTNEEKMLGRQGFITVQRVTAGSPSPYAKQDLVIKAYSVSNQNDLKLEFERKILAEKYDRSGTWGEDVNPPYPMPKSGWSNIILRTNTTVKSAREFDLDGDSLSELMIQLVDYNEEEIVTYYNNQLPDRQYNNYQFTRYVVIRPYAEDMNQYIQEVDIANKDVFTTGVFGDFAGEGKPAYFSGQAFTVFEKKNDRFSTVYKSIGGGKLEGVFESAVVGDFNGDGKADLLLPKADKSSDWYLYLSKGDYSFEKQLLTNLFHFIKEPVRSDEGRHHNIIGETYCYYATTTYYNFAADDLDGDGRAEFIASKVEYRNHSWNSHYNQEYTRLSADIYTTSKTDNSIITFDRQGGTKEFYFANVVVPFSSTTMYKNGKKVIVLGKPDNCGKADCESFIFLEANQFKDITKYSRITNISQAGIETQIDYQELDPTSSPNLYAGTNTLSFPFVELDKVSQSYAVSQLRQYAGYIVRKQDFRYRGLITHLQGKGMIGFRQTARSTWYTDNLVNTKIWSGAEIDPFNDGVPIKEWSVKANSENDIFPADISENNSQLLSFKSTEYRFDKLLNGNLVDINTVSPADKPKVVSATVPVKSVSKDFMIDVRSENRILYDKEDLGPVAERYYLPTKTTNSVNNDFAVSTTSLEYIHNASGTGKDYYIGRPASKKEQMAVYGDTKGAKEEYAYKDHLLKTKKSWNRDSSGWFLETYGYDDFGNITEKTVTTSLNSNHSKTDRAQYDPKGRFVITKTDNLGLETHITYNDWGQIETQTDPLGNILTNTYDDWGKALTSKTNLGGTTTYQYKKESTGDALVTEYAPDGTEKISYTNKLGQSYLSMAKKFGQDQYVSVKLQYDSLGRKIGESEPYTGDTAPHWPANISYDVDAKVGGWNIIKYNDNVPQTEIKAISFNDKRVQTSVSGRITVTKELNGYLRTTAKTTDAIGNVISSSDKGGLITFKFNAAGENIEANYEGNIVKTAYDAWGNKVRFEDPSNGVYEYQYNGYFGALSKIKSPKGEKIYEYNSFGQLTMQKEKTTVGNATDKVIKFTYNSKGLITGKSGTSLGKAYSSGVMYDAYGRVLSSYENSNGKYFLKKGITYDSIMRITSYEKQLYSSGILTKVSLENEYDTWSGALYRVKEKGTGKVLWQLDEANDKGQVRKAKLGGVNIENWYTDSGFLDFTNHQSAVSSATVLYVKYTFDAVKNELKNRATLGEFNIIEQFQYDDNNRLYNWTDAVTGVYTENEQRNVYDNKGRITQNDQVGIIKFGSSSKKYQATGMVLNAAGTQNFTNDLVQKITYNENNDAFRIDGVRGDVAFEYGLTSMRQRVTYGGNFDEGQDGKFTKYYSEDGSYEVIRNNQTGQEKHLIYIGGSPYESDIVFVKNYTESSGSFKFLHKDYLGSVLAITDEAGNKLEQRHFDAWGQLTHLKIGNNAIITDKEQIRNYLSDGNLVVDRGYTSHEHFAEVGLIHMNGRLYDPLLRRFLNADEHIQDPHNTQNYNKYGYVMNNPLMYNDPSGEFLFLVPVFAWIAAHAAAIGTAALIGAAIGAGMYAVQAAITRNWSWGGFAKSIFMGALTGAVSGGLGQVFSTAGFWATVGNGALAGAGSGGITSLINGTNFLEGLVKGAVIGGAVGAVSYGIKSLVTKTEYNEIPATDNDIANSSNNTSLTTADAKETWNNNWKQTYESTKDARPAYLMEKGVAPKGYSQNTSTGLFNGNNGDSWGVTVTKYNANGKVINHKMYISNAAYSSKAQLNYVVNHEFGHMVINNYVGNGSFVNDIIGKGLLDSEAHKAIQYTGQKFLQLNGWQNLNLGGVFKGPFIGGFVPENDLLNRLSNLIIKIK